MKLCTGLWLRRWVLLTQVLMFYLVSLLVPGPIRYFSAYRVEGFEIWVIPALLFLASFFEKRSYQSILYVLAAALFIFDPLIIAVLAVFFLIYFFLVKSFLNGVGGRGLTIILYGFIGIFAFSSIYYLHSDQRFSWLWMMLHMTWALKLLAWTVTARVYHEHYSYIDFLDYFFNPTFFFFTNDLNVLTPRLFLRGRVEDGSHFSFADALRVFQTTVMGVVLLVVYGLLQFYYFRAPDQLGIIGTAYVGSVISIATALIFHGGNSCLQVSMLNAFQFNLRVDMDKPWLTASPADYWKRMHFYVRDYIFEIITKPLLTVLFRWNVKTASFKIVLISIVYLIFSCTQIGYQPYRMERSWLIGFLVTGVFVMMMAVPEFALSRKARLAIEKKPWLGRIMTFAILYMGYYFIFIARRGF